MVCVLILINIFDSICFEQSCPKDVPSAAVTNEVKTSHLKCVDHSVVGMSGVVNLKTKLLVYSQIFLGQLNNPRKILR